ncbi:hypothetical protein FRB95_011043 [Tulasnella sp. JGI-2019a]|nr:hypothetical protein FRB95_011043 [Tulasnella sp. JGI-2019a]
MELAHQAQLELPQSRRRGGIGILEKGYVPFHARCNMYTISDHHTVKAHPEVGVSKLRWLRRDGAGGNSQWRDVPERKWGDMRRFRGDSYLSPQVMTRHARLKNVDPLLDMAAFVIEDRVAKNQEPVRRSRFER